MALVRCPSCGRVADGKMCFACGYEWPDGAAAAPSSPEPVQAFTVAAPTSFPTAAVVAAAVVAPTAPPALPLDDEIDLDVDFEDGTVDSAPATPPLPPLPPPSSPFGTPAPSSFPSPSNVFGVPALAPFPSPSSAFGVPALSSFSSPSNVFGAPALSPFPPPSNVFGAPALSPFPPPSSAFGAPAPSSLPPPSNVFGALAPSSLPPPSSAFGAPALASFAPTLQAPSASLSAPALPSVGGARLPGAFGGFPASSFLTSSPPPAPPAPPAPAASPADAPFPEIPAAPDPWAGAGPSAAAHAAALDVRVNPPLQSAQGDAPSINVGSMPSWVSNPTVQVSAGVAGARIAALEPSPSAPAVSPPEAQATPSPLSGLFDGLETQHKAVATVSQPPAFDDDEDGLNFTLEPGATLEPEPEQALPSLQGFGIEPADDAAPVPPPGASVDGDGGFAELDGLDLEGNVDDLVDVPSAEADLLDETFEMLPDAPALLSAAVTTPAIADESSFAALDDALEHNDPPGLDGEAAFDAFRLDGLGPTDVDGVDGIDGVDVDGSLEALAELDRQIMSAESALATTAPATLAPSLSERVGTLAESLEGEGRIGDAAMLYEVQAVLAGAGR